MGYEGDRLASLFNRGDAEAAARAMARRAGSRWLTLVKENTPIGPPPDALDRRHRHRRPGELRASWKQKPTRRVGSAMGGGEVYEAGVETEDRIAPFVEWSTRPHEIRPIAPRRRLAFVVGGRWVFPRVVHHPGTTGQAMTRVSASKLEHEIRGGYLDPVLRVWKLRVESRGRLGRF